MPLTTESSFQSYVYFVFSFSKEVAILCSFLLGLGDSCFNTQLLSILGFLYSEDSAPAFAVFKFVQVPLGCTAVRFFLLCWSFLPWVLVNVGLLERGL